MRKIKSYYLHNVGFQHLWFDDSYAPCCSPVTTEPVHTVFGAGNGSGKSTSIALLFSNLVPDRNKFLRTQKSSVYTFNDYFDNYYNSPGFVVIEFDAGDEGQKDLFGKGCSIIVGQAVCLTQPGKPPFRVFFSFKNAQGIDMNSLINGSEHITPLKDLDSLTALKKWLVDMRTFSAARKHPADFFDTKNQDDWMHHLSSRRIDLDLARLQWRYNKTEGGGEVKEANSFLDQRDFFRRFMELCLSEKISNALKENLELSIKLLRNLPLFEKQLQAFRTLEDGFTPFCQAAQDLRKDNSAREVELRQASGLLEALTRGFSEKESEQTAHQLLKTQHKQRATKAKLEQKDAEARKRGIEKAVHEATIRDLKRVNTEAKRHHSNVRKRHETLKARKALISIDAHSEHISEIDRQLEIVGAEVSTYRNLAKEAGAKYRSALMCNRSLVAASAARYDRVSQCLKKAAHTLKEYAEALGKAKDDQMQKQVKIEAAQEQAKQQRERLHRDGVLEDNESGLEAQRRIHLQIKQLEQEKETATTTQTTTRTQITDLQATIVDREKEGGKLKQQAEETARTHARGLEKAQALAQEIYRGGLIDTSAPDLESPLIERKLVQRRDELDEQAATLAIEQGTLEIDITSVDHFKVLGIDHNVAAVVRALTDLGIEAMPYGSYLAGIFANAPESARAVYLSDPARFSGVQVLDEGALAVARTLAPLRLDRPVVVSLPADTPSTNGSEDCIIINHKGNALYNEKAALASSKKLAIRFDQLAEKQLLVRNEAEQISGWLTRLTEFLDEFGCGKLAAFKRQEEHLLAQKTNIDIWLKESQKTLQGLKKQFAQEAEILEDLDTALNQERAKHVRVAEFVTDHESKTPELKRNLDRHTQEIKKIKSQQRRNILFTQKTNDQRDRFIKRHTSQEGEIARLDDRLKQITHFNENQYAIGADFESYKSAYDEALDNLKAKESGKEKNLNDRRKNILESQQKELETYSEAYHHLPEAEVREVSIDGIDTAIAAIQSDVSFAEAEVGKTKSALDSASGEFTSDKKRWQRENLAIVEPDLDNSLSVETLRDILNEAEDEILLAANDYEDALRQASHQEKLVVDAEKALQTFSKAIVNIESTTEQHTDTRTLPRVNMQTPALDVAVQLAEDQRKRLNELTRKVQEHSEKAQNTHRAFLRLLETDDVRTYAARESAYMLQAGRNSFEAFIADADEKKRFIKDRIKMLEDSIAKSEEDLQNCADALAGGMEHGLRLLKLAVKFKVPESVPFIGGQPVLKINLGKILKTKLPLSEYLKRFVKRLVSDGNSIPNGHRLIADAICHVAEQLAANISVCILKPIPVVGRYEHVDISSYNSSSGGEGLTSALMYYLLAAHIRGMERGRSINFGGALILDNPIGEANLALLLQAQREIATSLGIQLIYYTGIKDLESLREFDHHVALRASKREDRHTGRRYLEMWPIETQESSKEVFVAT